MTRWCSVTWKVPTCTQSGSAARSRTRCGAAARPWGDAAPPGIRLHDLRHTLATHWLASGAPVKVVSERLGHASPVITMDTYQHVLPGMQRGWAERLAMGGQVADKLHGAGEAR
jgi:integrase